MLVGDIAIEVIKTRRLEYLRGIFALKLDLRHTNIGHGCCFSALLAKQSATVASSKSMTLKHSFDNSRIIRNFAQTLTQKIYVTTNPFMCFYQHYIF